jgi:hypothetical protein
MDLRRHGTGAGAADNWLEGQPQSFALPTLRWP